MFAAIVAAIVAAVLATGGVVVAADGAVPGDPLYGIDRAVEQLRLDLTPGTARAVQLKLAFADERLLEAEQLASGGDEAYFEEALYSYGDAVSAAALRLGGDDGDELAGLLDAALKQHNDKLEQVFRLRALSQVDADDEDDDATGDDDDDATGDDDDATGDDDDATGDDDDATGDDDDATGDDDDDATGDDDDDENGEQNQNQNQNNDDDDDAQAQQQERERERERNGEGCVGVDPHPAATRLAAMYDADYDDIMDWFCSGYGFGEIMLALSAGQQVDDDPEDLLAMKSDLGGWGQVWRSLGLVNKGRWGQAPTTEADDDDDDETPTRPGRGNQPDFVPPGQQGRGENDADAAGDDDDAADDDDADETPSRPGRGNEPGFVPPGQQGRGDTSGQQTGDDEPTPTPTPRPGRGQGRGQGQGQGNQP